MERFAIKIDKKLKANLYKICRLCGIDNPEMVPILASDGQHENVAEAMDVDAEPEMPQKIKLLIGLVVAKDDKMPQTMCSLCVDKINDFYEFREMCYATNAQTRKLLGLKNIKKAVVDIKPKVEVKEEEPILPKTTGKGLKPLLTTSTKVPTNAKGLKSSIPTTTTAKLLARDSRKRKQEEPEEIIGRESRKRKQEDLPLSVPLPKKEPVLPAVSNKKLRLAAAPLKEAATKKAKQKNKEDPKDVEVKEEIKEEPKEEKPTPPQPPPVPTSTVTTAVQANKLKQACTICTERFATKSKLEAHTRLQHVPKIERYVCTACNETMSKSFDIKNHQLWHKLSKTPYICGLCGESIVSTYAYARHVREHCFETPPAFLVLDRECPQCHVSYATNYLYNTHPCAVKAKRCAGCNRLQRSDTEFIKHSALCAKVYLNYSKHIMPAVEAQEDEVRIKNENDVEAAAEEMARLTGMPLDMAPVVQLTRLSSPLIMAANQCVSIPSIEDSPSTSSKKTGKKGVSKKELKRVDELLKSTLDALVSIKHEPEVHVDTEPPPAEGEQSDNGGHSSDDNQNMDTGFQEDDSDHEDSTKATQNTEVAVANPDDVAIKQEVDETHGTSKPEDGENSSKLTSGGGLKLKIRKEHGQLNSSIIEQQKSVEKRAEKRKKKKKHKDKVKDKLKLQKEQLDEQNSLDSFNTQHNDDNISSAESPAAIRIKAEPVDEMDNDGTGVSTAQGRPLPEATIMTSIPMMQLQIACISEGVDFNGSNATTAGEDQQINITPAAEVSEAAVTVSTKITEHEDVKPNREELDRMLQISNISSGIAMETDEMETELHHDGISEGDRQIRNDVPENNHENEDRGREDEENEDQLNNVKDTEVNTQTKSQTTEEQHIGDEEEQQQQTSKTSKPIKPKIIKPKPAPKIISVKSRNKACKSTAKPSVPILTPPVLQISSVQSGVSLSLPTESAQNDFTPIFIKPEPQNRGYSDEPPPPPPLCPPSPTLSQDKPDETVSALQEQEQINNEEQSYISSLDFNNITIKQEKDLDINDVQITDNKTRYCKYSLNGLKKRKVVRRVQKKRESFGDDDDLEDADEKMSDGIAEDDAGEEEEEELSEEEEEEEEQDEDEPEYDEDPEEDDEDEEEEEREYRELEYPPELKTTDGSKDEEIEDKSDKEAEIPNNLGDESVQTKNDQDSNCTGSISPIPQESLPPCERDKILMNESSSIVTPVFVISSVCSQAPASVESADSTEGSNQKLSPMLPPPANNSTDTEKVPTKTQSVETLQDSFMSSEQKDIDNLQLLEPTQEIANPYQALQPKSPVLKIASVTSGAVVSDMQSHADTTLIEMNNQIVVNNVDNVDLNELQNIEAVSHNIAHDQCEGSHESQEVVDDEAYLNLENTKLEPSSVNELNTPVAGGSDVINHGDEEELLLSKVNTPVEIEIVEKDNHHDQIDINITEGAATANVTDENIINYHQSTPNTISTQIDAEEPLTEGLNLQHQCEISAESNLAAHTMTSEMLGELNTSGSVPQIQNITSTAASDTGEHTVLETIDSSTCQYAVNTVTDIAVDPNSTNVATKLCQQETPITQVVEKSVEVIKQSETYVDNNVHENADSTVERETQGFVSNDVNAIATENTTNQFSSMEIATTSIACASHNYDSVQSAPLEYTRSETIEGIVEQTNDLQLLAKPLLEVEENIEHSCANQEEDNEIDEDEDCEDENYDGEEAEEEEEEEEDGEKEDHDDKTNQEMETLVEPNINLEEQQNQQNQQQQQENLTDLARPTALALHPYLEDISSSSNSFLSNTLSQTPPPTQTTSNNSTAQPAPSHHNEETENVLNESSDVFSHRPSFNFDNVNEIAENNNNANLEREQLQDDQQQRNDAT